MIWVRHDREHSGGTGSLCDGAAALASDATRNDFDDGTDDPSHVDHGGLVREADIDGDGVDDIYADVQLLGETDGRVDEDPHYDDDDDTLTGIPHDTGTYSLCWADGSYSVGNPPQFDSDFQYIDAVRLHIMHMCALMKNTLNLTLS